MIAAMSAVYLLTSVLLQPAPGVMHHFPRWSPDGTAILASSTADGDAEIYIFMLDGRPPRKLTDNGATDDSANWTRDGRHIRFMSDRRGKLEPFVMDADGSNQRPSTDPVDLSTDGQSRLIEAHVGGRGVIVAESADGQRRVLTTGPHAEQASFAPDGQRIVYEQRSTAAPDDVRRSNVVLAAADGSYPRIISPGTDPSWSPDGRSLVFKVWSESDQQLWIAVALVDGWPIRRLSPGVHPHWSPDGRRIAFMREEIGRTDVWTIDVSGSGAQCVTCRF
jgi:Tol biopolymer transport system component